MKSEDGKEFDELILLSEEFRNAASTSVQKLWRSVTNNDVDGLREALQQGVSLATRDFGGEKGREGCPVLTVAYRVRQAAAAAA